MVMYHQTKFRSRRISSSEDMLDSHFDYMILHCDLDLEDSKPIFLKTIWLIMMHHQTKFGSKKFGVSEDIIWTNIH